MELFLIILFMLIGLVLIIKGGDWFVDAAAWMAEVSGIPKLIVGATVVSFATTMPELLVSVFAASKGNVDVSIGNAVGSVTANTGLIMALSLIFIPSVIKRKDYLFKSVMMLAAGALLFALSFTGEMKMIPSLLLLVLFFVFMWDNLKNALDTMEKNKEAGITDSKQKQTGSTVAKNIVKFIIGIAAIVIGARLLVDNGTLLAQMLGVSDRIIAVTIIAIGTSLPELVTTVTAIIKKQSELSVGNIIGANIIDITLILPVSALVSGGSLTAESRASVLVDMPVMIFIGAVALIPSLITKKFSRWQGILLLVLYLTYSVLTCTGVLSF